MRTKIDWSPGTIIEFLYPRHNFHGVVSKMEKRRVRVEAMRDLKLDPIERITFEIQPLLRRGRHLVTGIDLEKEAERSFYVDSMKSVRCLPSVIKRVRNASSKSTQRN